MDKETAELVERLTLSVEKADDRMDEPCRKDVNGCCHYDQCPADHTRAILGGRQCDLAKEKMHLEAAARLEALSARVEELDELANTLISALTKQTKAKLELEAENARLDEVTKLGNISNALWVEAEKENRELKAENARLKTVLRYYGENGPDDGTIARVLLTELEANHG